MKGEMKQFTNFWMRPSKLLNIGLMIIPSLQVFEIHLNSFSIKTKTSMELEIL
jgi:hypothetical protein